MALPFLLYENILEDTNGTLTASSSASGFGVDNLNDRLIHTQWKASAAGGADIEIAFPTGSERDADCVGIAFHNLSSAGNSQMVVQYGDDGVSWSDAVDFTLLDGGSPWADKVVVETFTNPGAKRYWRLHLTGPAAAAPFIGWLCLGERYTFTEYWSASFDEHAISSKARTAISRGGQFVGAVAETGAIRKVTLRPGGGAGIDDGEVSTYATSTMSLVDYMQNYHLKYKPSFFHTGLTQLGRPGLGKFYAWPPTNARVRAPWLSPTRRKLQIDLMLWNEGIGALTAD